MSSNWVLVNLPTFSLFGSPLPFGIPKAFLISTAAGGVFTINVNDLSSYTVITTGNGKPFSAFCVSALNDMGTGRLMGFIDNVAPSAADLKPEQSVEGKTIECKTDAPTSLFIFKTLYEPNLGQISFFKVKSGEIKQNDKLENSRNEEIETLNQLYIINGKNREPVEKLSAGDIGATLKLKYTETNDTLRVKDSNITIKPIKFPEPRITKAISAVDKNDEEKLLTNDKSSENSKTVEIVENSLDSLTNKTESFLLGAKFNVLAVFKKQ